MALLAGACSMPAKFAFFGRDDRADSVNAMQSAAAFSNADLAVASAATTALLERDGASGPWENPLTGARGTVTPIAAVYRDNGSECRDFLSSYVREKAEAWMEGEACRNGFGRWEVRSFRPWQR